MEHELKTDLHMEISAEMDSVWAKNKKKTKHYCVCERNSNFHENMNNIVHWLKTCHLGICTILIQPIKDQFKVVAEL